MTPALKAAVFAALVASTGGAVAFEPLTIVDQGSLAAGGTVIRNEGAYDNEAPTAAGQTFHGDHVYAFY